MLKLCSVTQEITNHCHMPVTEGIPGQSQAPGRAPLVSHGARTGSSTAGSSSGTATSYCISVQPPATGILVKLAAERAGSDIPVSDLSDNCTHASPGERSADILKVIGKSHDAWLWYAADGSSKNMLRSATAHWCVCGRLGIAQAGGAKRSLM